MIFFFFIYFLSCISSLVSDTAVHNFRGDMMMFSLQTISSISLFSSSVSPLLLLT